MTARYPQARRLMLSGWVSASTVLPTSRGRGGAVRSRVRGWAVGMMMVGVLAVSACDLGEGPTEPASSAESSTATDPATSESPTADAPTPPEVDAPTPPPEMAVNDHVGAIWATRYFLDLYTYMRASGNTAAFEGMSAPECDFCASSIENAEEITADGGWAEGGALVFDINEATAEYPTDSEPNYLVRFSMTQERQVIHRPDGSVEEVGESSADVVVAMRYVDGRFICSGVNSEQH